MSHSEIGVKGARQHNLRDLNVQIPKNAFVVFTGPSGSGKSSLAFDTLFSEGQRRYIESLSVYARQFLGKKGKADVDEIRGLSPTVSIEQKSVSHNPRSTVGTITEIHDYLRLFFARLGTQHCHVCGDPVGMSDASTIHKQLLALPHGTRFVLYAPLVRNRKGEFRELFEQLRQQGYHRVRVDGELRELADLDKVRKSYRHAIDVVVDRLIQKDGVEARLRTSIDRGLLVGDGEIVVAFDSGPEAGTERTYSRRRNCTRCDIAFPELTQQSFSFNSPLGQCPACLGLGEILAPDEQKLIDAPAGAVASGAFASVLRPQSAETRRFVATLAAHCAATGIDDTQTFDSLTRAQQRAILDGDPDRELTFKSGRRKVAATFDGVLAFVRHAIDGKHESELSDGVAQCVSRRPCAACDGTRLRAESRAVRFGDLTLGEINAWAIASAHAKLNAVTLDGTDAIIGTELLGEIVARLEFLRNVGVGYLALGRSGPTLSGGEAQRIRLASQLGSELTGVLYVLDEPSIGLHQRDNRKLIDTLIALRDRGNSVLVVEHDRETMEAADRVYDFGPGAGENGGDITFEGTPLELARATGNVTGDYLSGRRQIDVPATRRTGRGPVLRIEGATHNNLKEVSVDFPLGTFICVTGVSGSGKSSLINGILYPALANHHYKEIRDVGAHRALQGRDLLDKIIRIDQRPIGRSPRSNPATYTKVLDEVRDLFASLPESRVYGYAKGRFSFNVAGGRCESCRGGGVIKIEMGFLADAYVRCETCRGQRFNEATLRVRYRDHNIADVLNLSVARARDLFEAHPRLKRKLETLLDVGLGYVRLGQPSTTLSGGEAQRIKLSRELAKVATGDTVYILDEPSTGLHFDDIRKLLQVVELLVDAGNTVIMIEHNLDIIKVADHVIDMGPEAGVLGGEVVVSGTPEEVARCAGSHTGRYLAEELGNRPSTPG